MIAISVFGASTFAVIMGEMTDPAKIWAPEAPTFTLKTVRLFLSVSWLAFAVSIALAGYSGSFLALMRQKAKGEIDEETIKKWTPTGLVVSAALHLLIVTGFFFMALSLVAIPKMSNSRSRGPPLPTLVQGSSLQAQLESEGAQIFPNNNRPLIEHIINHATPGYVTKVVWLREETIIEHEYLLMCIKTYDGKLSWMRIERMGDLPVGSAAINALKDQAQLVVTLAPSRDSLICGDRVLVEADLDTNSARLSDVAKLILIVHNEEPQYHLQWHNCWWLARVIMQVLSETYMHSNKKQRKKVTSRCDSSHNRHVWAMSGGGPFAGIGQMATIMHFRNRRKRIMANFTAQLYS
ncbi:hypothetical protein F53441_9570 [Fusarium austroafricanum]|uniref:Uncharacterized protein n=1 Tax=Fusarium austroafricanum TaxID=2364996 RepID=A0A8H4NW99_9HYPO|nr:hypothetical protein F53441_9570 [Fusarium austroafricanum]